jgi:hypothetical protein
MDGCPTYARGTLGGVGHPCHFYLVLKAGSIKEHHHEQRDGFQHTT